MPLMLYLLGPDGKPTFLSRELLNFHGVTAEEFAHGRVGAAAPRGSGTWIRCVL